MRRLILTISAVCIAPLLMAGSCATTGEPRIEIRTVNVPVAVPCDPVISPAPDYPDKAEVMANVADTFEAVKRLKAGRILRDARIGELEAALKGCASTDPPQ